MRIDIVTLFPEMCERVMDESIIGRARRSGALQIYCHQLRDYSTDKHQRVDDTPYGPGRGMLLMAEPVDACCKAIAARAGQKPHIIYLSPKGKVLTQQRALALSNMEHILLLCGHYEGVDQRVLDEIVDEELSIGDYVLTGGELAALVVADAVARLCPGVLTQDECFTEESHFDGLLEYPHYTRPAVWHGREVPEVLQSGHHGKIAQWRREQSLLLTAQTRPDLLEKADLTPKDKLFLAQQQTKEKDV